MRNYTLPRIAATTLTVIAGCIPLDCPDKPEVIELCDDSCYYSQNGICEDGGVGSSYHACDFGTDCYDCGPRLVEKQD